MNKYSIFNLSHKMFDTEELSELCMINISNESCFFEMSIPLKYR